MQSALHVLLWPERLSYPAKTCSPCCLQLRLEWELLNVSELQIAASNQVRPSRRLSFPFICSIQILRSRCCLVSIPLKLRLKKAMFVSYGWYYYYMRFVLLTQRSAQLFNIVQIPFSVLSLLLLRYAYQRIPNNWLPSIMKHSRDYFILQFLISIPTYC